MKVLAAALRLRGVPGVAYAEPDYLMRASATPNDPSFPLQWAASNTGQIVPSQNAEEVLEPAEKGTVGADDRALPAWSVTTGSRSIVIGEVDTGIEYTHPDLAANIWSNPGGIGGCAAGTHGYNVLNSTCDPTDDDTAYGGHGSHVAGIMGAVGNNGTGVAGMNWQTSLLPVKWLDSKASGSTSGLIAALQWLVAAKQAGVNIRVVNDSATFFGTTYSQALQEEIDTLAANNILFVTAAGNTGNNNDEEAVRRYPCGYDRPNELCVTATDTNDQLPSWANYGPHTVDLAAPGVSIYSTLRKGTYGYLSGGSMASPQVAGAAALILSVSPSLSATALKADILEHVDPLPWLAGKVISGGRLDVCKAITRCIGPPARLTFGKTNVGASADSYLADRKRVNRYSLAAAGSLTKLSIYLAPSGTAGQQVLKGVVYSDAAGRPETLLGISEQLTFTSTGVAGWYDLVFPSPLKLAPANYWIGVITGASSGVAGVRYDSVSGSRDYNTNAYTSGPSSPFGSFSTDSEQTSLYATYTTNPVNLTPPGISGTARQEQTLTELHGSWTNSPTGYAYQWLRCDGSGGGCLPISAATAQTYVLGAGDVGHTIGVQELADNAGGWSSPATSTATAIVAPSPIVPTVVTGSASSVTQTTATLNATVNPNGSVVSECTLAYGPTSSYGSSAPCTPAPGSGSSPVAVSAPITGLAADSTYHFRVSATNAGGTGGGSDQTLRTLPKPPTVETCVPSVTQSTAKLCATVNPNGGEVSECKFEYGTTSSYGASAPCTPPPGSGSSPVEVSAEVTGLAATTTYHFRVVATNPGGTSRGSDQTFKTLPNAPTVETIAASSITQTAATLSASVNPNGGEVGECKLEYGTTTSYGANAPCTPSPGSAESPVEVQAEVTGLTPNTEYHFRISATNAGGTSKGSDATFKTPPHPPTVLTGAASAVKQTSATLNATVNPNSANVSACTLEYGPTTSYGSSAACTPSPGSGESSVAVSGSATGLTPSTEYHFRISATNAGGTSTGEDATFATLPARHYYKNGMLIKEGERVPVIGWGTLTLTSTAGSVTCHSASMGYVENTPGDGIGATQAFSTYECVTAGCPLETRAEAFELPWASELFEEAGVTRSRSTGVEMVIGCWTTAPSGPGNLSTAERGSPVAELLPFAGESTPSLANGKSAGKPTNVQFGAGSSELVNGKVGGGKTTGQTTLMVYTDLETITTGA